MSEEKAFALLPFSCERLPGILKFSLEVNLEKIIPRELRFKAGISTVIKAADGKFSFWALAHPGVEADFHRQDCFLLGF